MDADTRICRLDHARRRCGAAMAGPSTRARCCDGRSASPPIGCTSRNDRFWSTATSDGTADRCARSVFDGRAGAHRCTCIFHCICPCICATCSALARRSARSHSQIAAGPCASVGACRCRTGTGTRALRRCSRSGAVVAGTDCRRQCCSRSRTHRSATSGCTDRREPGRCVCRCIACTNNIDAPCCDAFAHIGRVRRTILGDGPQQIHILHIARRHGVRPGCNRGRSVQRTCASQAGDSQRRATRYPVSTAAHRSVACDAGPRQAIPGATTRRRGRRTFGTPYRVVRPTCAQHCAAAHPSVGCSARRTGCTTLGRGFARADPATRLDNARGRFAGHTAGSGSAARGRLFQQRAGMIPAACRAAVAAGPQRL